MKPENEKEIKIPLEKKETIKTTELRLRKQKDNREKSGKPKFDFLNRLSELVNVFLRCLKMMIEGSFYRHCGHHTENI